MFDYECTAYKEEKTTFTNAEILKNTLSNHHSIKWKKLDYAPMTQKIRNLLLNVPWLEENSQNQILNDRGSNEKMVTAC